MSVETFIPSVWAAELLATLHDEHRYANCVNRNYEGEIKGFGSSVRINTIGPVSVKNYTRSSEIDAAESLNMADQLLVIDQAKYFHFKINDVDKAQARSEYRSDAMREAGNSVADTIDDFLATTINTGVDGTANDLTNGTPIALGQGAGEKDAYALAVQMAKVLDESNTPRSGRWLVVPAFFDAQMRLDNRFVGFGTTSSQSRAFSGRPVAEAAGFTIYMSNRTPTGASSSRVVLGGYKGAVTYAEQIEKMEAYRIDRGFDDAIKELHVYGAKVTRPSNLVAAEVTEGEYL